MDNLPAGAGTGTDTDVLVVGLGSFGSAAADHLTARGDGLRITGIEQFDRGHSLGSYHGGSRMIRMSYMEGDAYVPLLRRAFELWDGLEQDAASRGIGTDGDRIVHHVGGLYAGAPDSQNVAGALASARVHDLPLRELSAAQVHARWPQLTLAPGETAVFEETAGFVRPENTVELQLQRAESRGADLRFGVTVTGLTPLTGGGVRVTTTDGSLTARRVILTAGAWAPRWVVDAGIPLVVERRVMHWFDTSATEPGLTDIPVYAHDTGDGTDGALIYGFPDDGNGAKVGFHGVGGTTDPDHLDRTVHPEETAAMRERVASFLPGLAGAEQRDAVACMYSLSPDGHFVIGAHPTIPDVVIACGCSGHGFKFVPVIGEILADLAVDGTTRHDIALFDPRRFS